MVSMMLAIIGPIVYFSVAAAEILNQHGNGFVFLDVQYQGRQADNRSIPTWLPEYLRKSMVGAKHMHINPKEGLYRVRSRQ